MTTEEKQAAEAVELVTVMATPPSVSDHLLDALNLHRKGCAACRDSVDGCELARRIEAVMLEVNPSAYFTSEPIEPRPIETPMERLSPASYVWCIFEDCDQSPSSDCPDGYCPDHCTIEAQPVPAGSGHRHAALAEVARGQGT